MMKIRSKITAVTVPLLLFAVILVNLIFSLFFENYLEKQENKEVASVQESLSSFIKDKQSKYLGSVNDWAHWDDTYHYIQNENPAYPKNNLIPSTFYNLDIDFIIFEKQDGTVYDRLYYDLNGDCFSDFPTGFDADFQHYRPVSDSSGDAAYMAKIADEYYFIASSGITNSEETSKSIGKLFFGKLIDEGVFSGIEKATGCGGISILAAAPDTMAKYRDISYTKSLNDQKDRLEIGIFMPDRYETNNSVVFAMTRPRDLYSDGMKQIKNFALLNALLLGIASLVVFILLGNYLSKPFQNLIREVKSIDLNRKEFQKLQEFGNDEFSFLRKSINSMLKKIENEQNEVRENQEKLYATLHSVGDGVIAADIQERIQFLNPVAQKLTGWSQEDAFGQPIGQVFPIINEYTREPVENPIKLVFETQEIIQLANHTLLIAKDGSEIPIEDTAAPIKDKTGKVAGCVLVFRDFSERKEKQRRIEYLSYHDQLTGLYNRRYFDEEIKRLDTAENLPLSIVYADVNGLKTFNDAFGHHVGDQLIVRVSEIFVSLCRPNDVIVRTGGDEFILLFPKTDPHSLILLVDRIRARVEGEKIMNIGISISFGWDTKNASGQSSMDILKNAEEHMYQKKIYESSSKRSMVVKSILKTLQLKSPREEAHSKRVSMICESIGQAYNLTEDEIKELSLAGELHDIGKIAIDEKTLNKTKKLSESEWAQLKNHPETGFRILGTSGEYYKIAEYVLAHHEKWDGTGYPKGLKGKEIPWESRVIAVADAYDAMTSLRPYQEKLGDPEAVEELKKAADTQLDPEIVQVFIKKVLGISPD